MVGWRRVGSGFVRLVEFVALIAAAGLGTAAHAAAPYPDRPVRIIVPAAAGGITDVSARIVAQRLGDALGQPVVVENRAGGGGRVGAAEFARSTPDGYTLMFANSVIHALLPATARDVQYDPLKDFVPLGQLSSYTTILVCHPSVPFDDVRGLIAYAKAHPGALNFATAGQGSGNHFTAELFNIMAGVQTTSIHYRGNGPAMQDLVAGFAQCSHMSEVKSYVDSHRVKALATAGARRDPRFPALPTIDEAGVKGFHLSWWQELVAPSGVPPAVVARLARAVREVAEDPKVRKQTEDLGLAIEYRPPSAYAAQVKEDMAVFHRVAAEAHLSVD